MRRMLMLLALCTLAGAGTLTAQRHDAPHDSAMGPRMRERGGMMDHEMMARRDRLMDQGAGERGPGMGSQDCPAKAPAGADLAPGGSQQHHH